MSDTEEEAKRRDREIARNEEIRQATGAIRVSAWAIAMAVIIGLALAGWVLLYFK
jgi:cell division septal protein FtsQ